MQYLTTEDVVQFYAEAVGTPVLRYPDGLESAVGRPQQSAFGEDAYPTLALKAAALMHSLSENQPFVDGNKRIAWLCGKVFLRLYGFTIRATDKEAVDLFTNRIAAGMSIEELAEWISAHSLPVRDELTIGESA